MTPSPSVTTALASLLAHEIAQSGGWLPFDRFMHLALYAPGLGYYARDARQFGQLPASASHSEYSTPMAIAASSAK